MGEVHTPGPWQVRDGKYCLQIHSEKHWIANIKCESCPVHEVGNARLIAAAPELLEALEYADSEFARLGLPDDCSPRLNIRAAIANASEVRANG